MGFCRSAADVLPSERPGLHSTSSTMVFGQLELNGVLTDSVNGFERRPGAIHEEARDVTASRDAAQRGKPREAYL
jgi:hypothetical protein